MEASGNKSCSSRKGVFCWIFAIAHIAALTCIATALWQIWHVLKDTPTGLN
ncbi:MAG: hypothetical protein MK116_07945 [Phycisphaerales bacterium]|nr:hypothetical protein [Phycisphaerales bacterium]